MNSRMKQRRTELQIRQDLQTIMANASSATSLSELAKMSNLTLSQIQTTLRKFPNAERAMKQKLQNARLQKTYRLAYVIDASIINASFQVIQKIINENNIVILNVTLDELDNLCKDGTDDKAQKAHYIMDKAMYSHNQFVLVDYQKSHREKPDNILISYCKENKNRVILLTGDKNMALKAKGAGIMVEYYTSSVVLPPSAKRLENGDVVISTLYKSDESIRVIKDGKVYENITTPIKLAEGDQLFVATRVKKHIHFEHYLMLDDDGGNNLLFKQNLGFARREMKRIPREYRSFIQEFKRRHDKKYKSS